MDNSLANRPVEELLLSEVREKWNTLGNMQQELSNAQSTVPEGERTLASIYTAEEKRLKAEIELLQTSKPDLLPTDPAFLTCLVKNKLVENVDQLEQVLQQVQVERRELEHEIQQEKKLLEKQKQLNASLEEKLQFVTSHPITDGNESVLKNMKTKIKNIKKCRNDLQKEMMKFIQAHFPPPTSDNSDSSNQKGRRGSTVKVYSPLQTLLEDLMNKCIETPHDAYMNIDSTHWPPYIELLLRTGIAVRHPEDDNRIKLTPFHL